jgi:hypothetical protein
MNRVTPSLVNASIESKSDLKNDISNEKEIITEISETEQKLKNVFLEWMNNSTAHATPRLFKDLMIPLKIFWLIFMILSWAAGSNLKF